MTICGIVHGVRWIVPSLSLAKMNKHTISSYYTHLSSIVIEMKILKIKWFDAIKYPVIALFSSFSPVRQKETFDTEASKIETLKTPKLSENLWWNTHTIDNFLPHTVNGVTTRKITHPHLISRSDSNTTRSNVHPMWLNEYAPKVLKHDKNLHRFIDGRNTMGRNF